MKKFIDISNIAKDKFFFHYFGKTLRFFKIFYVELRIDESIYLLMMINKIY